MYLRPLADLRTKVPASTGNTDQRKQLSASTGNTDQRTQLPASTGDTDQRKQLPASTGDTDQRTQNTCVLGVGLIHGQWLCSYLDSVMLVSPAWCSCVQWLLLPQT